MSGPAALNFDSHFLPGLQADTYVDIAKGATADATSHSVLPGDGRVDGHPNSAVGIRWGQQTATISLKTALLRNSNFVASSRFVM